MAMEDSPERRSAVKEAGAGPAQRPTRPRGARRPFWFFAAAMLVAVAGGGTVVVMVKRTSAERRSFARDPDAALAPAARRARAVALVSRAEERRRAQDPSAAIPLYLAALEADPDLAEIQKELARCYQLQGDKKNAAERYRRYLATDPPDADRVKVILRTLE